ADGAAERLDRRQRLRRRPRRNRTAELERPNRAVDCEGEVLVAVDFIGNRWTGPRAERRRPRAERAGLELPHQSTGLHVVGLEIAARIAGEQQSGCGGERAASTAARIWQPLLPNDLSGAAVERSENAVGLLSWDVADDRAESEPRLVG